MDSLKNLNQSHLDENDKKKIETALAQLEALLQKKVITLSIDERRKYGSVNEQNKLLINKVYDFHKSQPALNSPDVDWEEFRKDYQSRRLLESIIKRLENLTSGLINAKILHDHDNYQAALSDYAYTNYKVSTHAPNFELKQNEFKQFFTRSKSSDKKNNNETNNSDTNNESNG